jgi:hypothetical protein
MSATILQRQSRLESDRNGRRLRLRLAIAAILVAGLAAAIHTPQAAASGLETAESTFEVTSTENQVCLAGAAIDGSNSRNYCFAYGYGPFAGTYVDALYSQTATNIAGRVTYAVCWGSTAWRRLTSRTNTPRSVYGFAYHGSFVINLAPRVCRKLEIVAYEGRSPGQPLLAEVAQAVDTVAHETMHASYSIVNEAKAECYGIQYTAYTAGQLGAGARYSRRLAVSAWRAYAGYRGTEYWSPRCRDGGAWDLNPQSSIWP